MPVIGFCSGRTTGVQSKLGDWVTCQWLFSLVTVDDTEPQGRAGDYKCSLIKSELPGGRSHVKGRGKARNFFAGTCGWDFSFCAQNFVKSLDSKKAAKCPITSLLTFWDIEFIIYKISEGLCDTLTESPVSFSKCEDGLRFLQ